MRIALFEPEIPGNVGAVLRIGACLGAAVDLIEPMGFEWDDRRVRWTAMDYIDHVDVARHLVFDAFRTSLGSRRLVLFTTKSRHSAYDFSFTTDDVLLFGKESAGVPSAISDACDAHVRLPIRPQIRSMNVATAAAIALSEALRQTASLPIDERPLSPADHRNQAGRFWPIALKKSASDRSRHRRTLETRDDRSPVRR